MRLTKKLKPPYKQVLGQDYVYTSETRLTPSFASVEQKLGQLEDVEEELGIDLNVLVKAFIYGIKTKEEKFREIMLCVNEEDNKHFLYFKDAMGMRYKICYLKDYEKTWWILTKEIFDE